jgi:hypothetical protein
VHSLVYFGGQPTAQNQNKHETYNTRDRQTNRSQDHCAHHCARPCKKKPESVCEHLRGLRVRISVTAWCFFFFYYYSRKPCIDKDT